MSYVCFLYSSSCVVFTWGSRLSLDNAAWYLPLLCHSLVFCFHCGAVGSIHSGRLHILLIDISSDDLAFLPAGATGEGDELANCEYAEDPTMPFESDCQIP